jgi:predicted Zn-dependent protease
MPSVDFRLHTANMLLKLDEFKKSVKILDTIIQEDDENAETWYLLAFNLCKLKKFDSSLECLKNVDLLVKK